MRETTYRGSRYCAAPPPPLLAALLSALTLGVALRRILAHLVEYLM